MAAKDADKLEDVVMERIYAAALKELKSRERCTAEYLRHTAIRTLLHKTTMFSPKVLLDAGADSVYAALRSSAQPGPDPPSLVAV